MKILLLSLLFSLISACFVIPNSTPIYDDFITLVAKDVNLGGQSLYKNEKLNHYKLDGIDAYCKEPSMGSGVYRCFSIENNMLVNGYNPYTSTWEALKLPVKVIQKHL